MPAGRLALGSAIALAGCGPPTDNDGLAYAIQRSLRPMVDAGALVGAVVEVDQRGRAPAEVAVGWRDREAGSSMRTDTIFRVASQTKAVVSVAALTLVEDGRLGLDDPVERYLPEWGQVTVGPERNPPPRPITVEDLLTHTAGLPYGDDPEAWYFADRPEPMREAVRALAGVPLGDVPGERWAYGYATDVLGVVLEAVTGQPLSEIVEERVTGPLGMPDTSFFLEPEKADRLAVVYGWDGRTLRRATDRPAPPQRDHGQGHYLAGPRTAESGGAGLLSTARDYSRFLQMIAHDGVLDGVRILEPGTVAELVRPRVDTRPGAGFSLAFSVRYDARAAGSAMTSGSYGWSGAYHTEYWIDPVLGISVCYLTQLRPARDLSDVLAVQREIYASLRGGE